VDGVKENVWRGRINGKLDNPVQLESRRMEVNLAHVCVCMCVLFDG